jgi:cell division protein FtsI/penicillin-binding protein 2
VDDTPDMPEPREPIWHDWRVTCRRRTRYLLVVLAVWSVAVSWRLLDVMVLDRETHLAQFRAQAWRAGTLPAARGRMMDERGLALAWSERYFRLVYEPPADSGLAAADLAAMQAVLPIDERAIMDRVYRHPGRDVVVVDELPVAQIGRVEQVVNAQERWRLQTGFRRRYATDDPRVRAALGQTRVYGQKEVGVSGWELEYDRRLRGTDGKYVVMVDRHGRWLPGTWRQLRPPQSGDDVFVPVTLY